MSNVKEELLNRYDKLCSITITNIYTLSKETKEIIISPEEYNLEHLFFVYSAIQTAATFDRKLYLSMRPFKYIQYVTRHFGKKGFNYFKWTWKKPNINIDEVLEYEADGNDVDITIFGDIYMEYYNGCI